MNDQQQSRADALTGINQFLMDVVTAAGLLSHGRTDKKLATRITDQAYELRKRMYFLAASPVEQPALLTAQDALAAIETFEIVGDNNDSREPNAEDRFILTEFVAHLFGGFRVELPAAAPADGACKRCGSTTAQACNDAGCFYLESGDGEPSAAPADERTASFEAWCDRFPEISAVERLRDAWQEARAAASPAAERVTAALQALSADVHTLGDGWANDEAMIGLAKKYLRVEPKPASPELSLWRDFVLLAVTDTAPQPAQADALGEEAYVAKRMTETLATVYATIIGDDEVDTDDGLNAIERVVRAAQVLRLEVDLYRAQADAPDDTHKFKNFHRRLCERFGYVHDEIDWRRDQVSLIEWIAKKADAPAEAREPIAWMTDDDRAITAAQKQRALADGGATASSVRPYSIPCYAVSAPADAEEARLTDAARDMLAERRRQVEAEGWTPEHDDQYQHGAIALAAACYAANAGGVAWADPLPSFWPWMHNWWKPTTPRRDLVKAGALILAELERLDRAALLNGADHDR